VARGKVACSLVTEPLNKNNKAKHVELSVEGLRTGVRFPPAPPTNPSGLAFVYFHKSMSFFLCSMRRFAVLEGLLAIALVWDAVRQTFSALH